MRAVKIVVDIPGEDNYDVRIMPDQLSDLGSQLKQIPALASVPRILVLTDDNVVPLYSSAVLGSLSQAGYKADVISVPAGEDSKSVEVASEVWQAMAELGFNRDCAVIALGGGVVGDLGGFIASTFMRGIPVVQVPTTLLSMVDSSVGGKTAINLPAGKNLVGTFMQPSYVCASIDTLATLDAREWACGCGEIAKSAAIDSDDFFFWLIEHAQDLAARDLEVASEAVKRSIVFKANVVAEDKTESKGVRECLNYGHTLAHAIEVLAGYGTFSHGAAVAEGMRFAALLGEKVVGTQSDFAEAQAALLDSLDLPYLDWNASPADIIEAMKHDKKARAGSLRFVLLKDVADWVIVEVEDAVVEEALEAFFEMKREAMEGSE